MLVTTSLLPPQSMPAQSTSAQSTSAQGQELAVVIDVLRATSVMATAIQHGAKRIVTCRQVVEATELASDRSPRPLLCGERRCEPIEGFDLGNSPAEYMSERVGGKELILTTTNGTRAIESAGDVSRMISASFLNFSAAVACMADAPRVHLICAGTDLAITAEDVLLAGAIIVACETRFGATVADDDSILARQLWRSWFPVDDGMPSMEQLGNRLRETQGGRNLIRVGFERDLERCAAVDSVHVVPTRCSTEPSTFALPAIP